MGGEGVQEAGEDRIRYPPGLVDMVKTEEHAVRPQIQRPHTPSILGSNTPRKRNSSPRIVLNTAEITNRTKNHQAPSSRCRISCDPKIASKL
jgi:hypothetical protein